MVVMAAQYHESTYCHWTPRLKEVKMVNFVFYVFCHNEKKKKPAYDQQQQKIKALLKKWHVSGLKPESTTRIPAFSLLHSIALQKQTCCGERTVDNIQHPHATSAFGQPPQERCNVPFLTHVYRLL